MIPLWPARLHHLRRDSADPERLAKFYGELLDDRVERLGDGTWLVAGRERHMVVGKGKAGAVPYFALQMQDAAHLAAYRRALKKPEEFSSPILAEGAYAVTDPDGRRLAFGLARNEQPESGLPGRLQHFVCATQRLPEMIDFY